MIKILDYFISSPRKESSYFMCPAMILSNVKVKCPYVYIYRYLYINTWLDKWRYMYISFVNMRNNKTMY